MKVPKKSGKKSLKKSKVFCAAPWSHAHIWPNGNVYPCCLADFREPFGNVKTSSFDDVWNGQRFREFRQNLLNDQPVPETCSRCYQAEEQGTGASLREYMNERFGHAVLSAIEKTENGYDQAARLLYWDFRFSNRCGFSCRSCNPWLSSSWIDDWRKLFGAANEDVMGPPVAQKVDLRDLMEKNLAYVQEIYFAGGEPLLMKEHHDLILRLLETGRTDVVLRYNTNAASLRYRKTDFIETWKNFDQVRVYASIDEIGERAEYWRQGTKWPLVVANLSKMAELSRSHPGFSLNTSVTVSSFNVGRLKEIHQFLHENHLHDLEKSQLSYNMVYDPASLDVRNMTDRYKRIVQKRLKDYIAWIKATFPGDPHDWVTKIEGISARIELPADLEQISLFTSNAARMDAVRKQDLRKVHPELFEAMCNPDEYSYRFMVQNATRSDYGG